MPRYISKQHKLIAVLLFLFLISMIPGLKGVWVDQRFWVGWAVYIHNEGFINTFSSGTDYPPVYQYVLWIYTLFAGDEETIIKYIGYLRIFTIAAEYWALWIVYKWIDRKVDYLFILLISVFNIAYSYNTLIWAQVDAILAAFLIAALYYLYHEKRLLSAVMIVIALNTKPQTIVLLPLWGLLMISSLQRSRQWLQSVWIVLAMIVTQIIIVIPFMFGKGGLAAVWQPMGNSVDHYTTISMNAYNMWYYFDPQIPFNAQDSERSSIGLNYFHIGLISFSIALFIVLWPVIKHTFQTLVSRNQSSLSRETIWLSAALSILVFFFFNTRMHERYSYYAFIFLAAYMFYTSRYGLYILFSLAVFLNLERLVNWFQLRNYETFIFEPKLVATLNAILIIWATITLYRSVNLKNTESSIPPSLEPQPTVT